MSKVVLEFTLPEENEAMQTAISAGDMRSAIADYDNQMRAIVRYGTRPELHTETVVAIREMLHDCLSDNSVKI
jgi:hypothetical protein